jgi:selenocysteine lyase/cysteine desulfurase
LTNRLIRTPKKASVVTLWIERRSGIVTFSLGSAEQNVALMEALLNHRVLVSVRYTSHVGGVRVSCHFYNEGEDIDRLLGLLSELTGR